ncbi:hypothetical protein LLH00_18365 [bacterium]|nr:hypothetical protein [bacterium]
MEHSLREAILCEIEANVAQKREKWRGWKNIPKERLEYFFQMLDLEVGFAGIWTSWYQMNDRKRYDHYGDLMLRALNQAIQYHEARLAIEYADELRMDEDAIKKGAEPSISQEWPDLQSYIDFANSINGPLSLSGLYRLQENLTKRLNPTQPPAHEQLVFNIAKLFMLVLEKKPTQYQDGPFYKIVSLALGVCNRPSQNPRRLIEWVLKNYDVENTPYRRESEVKEELSRLSDQQ